MNTVRALWKHRQLTAMLLAAFLFFVLFRYGPMYGLIIAFKEFNVGDGIWGSPWAGWKHFERLFVDPNFYRILENTLLINLYLVLFAFPAPIAFAIALNEVRHRWFQRFVQTTTYLPYFISWVVVSGLFIYFLSPTTGVVNSVVQAFGGEPIHFMGRKEYLRPILVISTIFKELGWNSIIYCAALSAIDPQLYEAAKVDGAKRWRMIVHITLPCLSPTITIMFILSLGGFMSTNFEQVINFLNPLNYATGDVIETYVYRVGLQQFQYSYTAAIGLFKSVIGLALVLTANAVVRKWSDGEQGLW